MCSHEHTHNSEGIVGGGIVWTVCNSSMQVSAPEPVLELLKTECILRVHDGSTFNLATRPVMTVPDSPSKNNLTGHETL
jgi:hypothetical protein